MARLKAHTIIITDLLAQNDPRDKTLSALQKSWLSRWLFYHCRADKEKMFSDPEHKQNHQ